MMEIQEIVHSFSRMDYILAGVVLGLFCYQVYFYVRYIAAVIRQRRRLNRKPLSEPTEWPGVSVIVCARNEEQNLGHFLHTLLEQDYPKFEVIVVNDGSEDRTHLILEEYKQKYPGLHVTFVPVDARVASSKKLALTLAVKAANYECLLLTDADCVPESNQWIKQMTKGFLSSSANQIVLGYSPYFPESTGINRIIRYDTLYSGLLYMGRALNGQPYMGVGRNMMYVKSLFIDNKGFSGLLTLRSGDDDLFVNKVATKTNTTVVCQKEALVWSLPKQTWREWIMQKRRHLSVSPYYKASTRMALGMENVMRGIWYAALIVCAVKGSMWVAALAGLLFLLRVWMQLSLINRSARRLGEKTFGLEIVWYDICLPLLNAFLLITQPKNQNNRW